MGCRPFGWNCNKNSNEEPTTPPIPLEYGEEAPEPINDPGIEDPRFMGNLSDPSVWVHNWEPPNEYSPQNYKNWMEEYKRKLKEKEARDKQAWENDPNNKNKHFDPNYPENTAKGWPPGWKNLGPPNRGDPPPPWARVEDGYGKAALCFQEPDIGTCKNYHVRFGYNPYKKDCAEFVYSGCEGNDNNFTTKKRCREVCTDYPKTRCQGGVAADIHGLTADDIPYLLHWEPTVKNGNDTFV